MVLGNLSSFGASSEGKSHPGWIATKERVILWCAKVSDEPHLQNQVVNDLLLYAVNEKDAESKRREVYCEQIFDRANYRYVLNKSSMALCY